MNKQTVVPTLCAVLFALCFTVEAQQSGGKIPRIGYVSAGGDPTLPGLWSRHSGKGCGI